MHSHELIFEKTIPDNIGNVIYKANFQKNEKIKNRIIKDEETVKKPQPPKIKLNVTNLSPFLPLLTHCPF